jgi:hypothetical protein
MRSESLRWSAPPAPKAAGLPAPSSAIGRADDLGNMWQFKRDFNDRYRAARDVNVARELNPALQRFEDWLRDNARRIPRG